MEFYFFIYSSWVLFESCTGIYLLKENTHETWIRYRKTCSVSFSTSTSILFRISLVITVLQSDSMRCIANTYIEYAYMQYNYFIAALISVSKISLVIKSRNFITPQTKRRSIPTLAAISRTHNILLHGILRLARHEPPHYRTLEECASCSLRVVSSCTQDDIALGHGVYCFLYFSTHIEQRQRHEWTEMVQRPQHM